MPVDETFDLAAQHIGRHHGDRSAKLFGDLIAHFRCGSLIFNEHSGNREISPDCGFHIHDILCITGIGKTEADKSDPLSTQAFAVPQQIGFRLTRSQCPVKIKDKTESVIDSYVVR